MTKVILLCGNPKCCPVVERNRDIVTITDDYGGKVKLTYEQYLKLKESGL